MKLPDTKLLFILCLILMVVVHAYTNWCGIGLTFDSYRYISASVELSKFYSLEPINGQIINRPPLYLTILAIFNGNLIGIRFLHLAIALGGLFMFEKVVSLYVSNVSLRNFALFLYATSTPLLINSSFAWSESFVILFALLQLNILLSDKSNSWSKSFWLIVILGIAIGLLKRGSVLLIPGVSLAILINNQSVKGVLKSLTYGFSAFMSTQLWDIYQGRLSIPSTKVPEATEYISVVSTWLMPMSINSTWREIGCSIFLLAVIIGYLVFRRNQSAVKNKNITIFLVLFFSYLTLRWKFASLDYFESDRYLSIGFPFFLLAVSGLFSWVLEYFRSSKKLVLAFFILWSSYSCIRYIKNAVQIHQDRCVIAVHSDE